MRYLILTLLALVLTAPALAVEDEAAPAVADSSGGGGVLWLKMYFTFDATPRVITVDPVVATTWLDFYTEAQRSRLLRMQARQFAW